MQRDNLLRDITANTANIRTEEDIINVVAETVTEKAIANEIHTKALEEEVNTYASKLNEYKNGHLSMVNARNKVAGETIKNMES